MSAKKAENLIRSARTDAGLTQEQLAKKVGGITRKSLLGSAASQL